MDERDRRFCSWLGIVFGPLFVLGGFLAAFTIVGALLVWVGLTLLAAGIALRTRLSVPLILVAAGLMLAGLTSYTAFVYP